MILRSARATAIGASLSYAGPRATARTLYISRSAVPSTCTSISPRDRKLVFAQSPSTPFRACRHQPHFLRQLHETSFSMAEMRTESDAFGEVQVPADKYWGAQTERSL